MKASRSQLYNRLKIYLETLTIEDINMEGSVYLLNRQISNLKDGKQSDLVAPFILIDIDTGQEGLIIASQGSTKFESCKLTVNYICNPEKTLSFTEQLNTIERSEILSSFMRKFVWGADVENARPLYFLGMKEDKDYGKFYSFDFKYKFYFEDYQNVPVRQALVPGVVPVISVNLKK